MTITLEDLALFSEDVYNRGYNMTGHSSALVDWWLAWTPAHPGEKETVQWDDEYRPFAVFAAPPLPEVVVQ